MTKKNDKKLCWNCDGSVSLHLSSCPYCGVDLQIESQLENNNLKMSSNKQEVPQSPYAHLFEKDMNISGEEWKIALEEPEVTVKSAEPEEMSTATKKEVMALLLLFPGIFFLFFGLILLMFSSNGIVTLTWKHNFAYFYFLGAIPLLLLGWRSWR